MIPKMLLIALLSCDPALTTLFTPRAPRLGRYEVCTTEEAIDQVAPRGWRIELREPLDVFGQAGTYDRAKLARLYAGRRARVARGWTQSEESFESRTLISPFPDATLTRLSAGTLVIVFRVAKRPVGRGL